MWHPCLLDLGDLSGLQVTGATLELTPNFNHSVATFSHQVFSSSYDSWDETTVSGLNRPPDSTLTLLSATDIGGVPASVSWNVLAGVNGADGLAGTGTMLTLLVRPDLAQAGNAFGPHFYDRTSASVYVPRLVLEVSPIPEPATAVLLALGVLTLTLQRKRPAEPSVAATIGA